MTLIEIFVLLIPITLGALLGAHTLLWMAGDAADTPGWRAFLQGLGAFAGAPLGLVAFFSVLRIVFWWRPEHPRCARGHCGLSDYNAVIHVKNPSEEEQRLLSRVERDNIGIPLRCQCGDLYLLYSRHRQMWKVDTDGSLVPYQYCRPFGRWRKDTRPRSAPPRP